MSPTKPTRSLTLTDIAELRELPFTPQRIRDAERLVADGIADVDRYGRRSWRDSECPGLRLVATRQGGVFYFVGRLDGRVQSRKLGETGTVDLAEARATAGTLKYDSTAAARIAPRKAVAGNADTFKACWEAYLDEAERGTFRIRNKRLRPNTLRSYRGVWNAALADYGEKPLEWVAQNLNRIILPIQEKTTHAGNRALALVSLLFRYAAQRRGWAGGNPVADSLKKNTIVRHEEKPRQRFLSDAERVRFRKACEDAPALWGDLFLLAWETGLRKRALLGLRWRHVHALRRGGRFVSDTARLVIPADLMKAGRSDHAVDLRPEAVAVLDRRYAARVGDGEDAFVFSWPDGRPLTSSPYERGLQSIAEAASIKGLRGHDLRRDLGARLVAAGVPLVGVAKILGHAQSSIAMLARTYQPVGDDTARAWLLNVPSIPKTKRSRAKAR